MSYALRLTFPSIYRHVVKTGTTIPSNQPRKKETGQHNNTKGLHSECVPSARRTPTRVEDHLLHIEDYVDESGNSIVETNQKCALCLAGKERTGRGKLKARTKKLLKKIHFEVDASCRYQFDRVNAEFYQKPL